MAAVVDERIASRVAYQKLALEIAANERKYIRQLLADPVRFQQYLAARQLQYGDYGPSLLDPRGPVGGIAFYRPKYANVDE